MEIDKNLFKCLSNIFVNTLGPSLERYCSGKGWAMPLIARHDDKHYIPTKDYQDKYMSSDEYTDFFQNRPMKELISDGVYTEYKGINFEKILKESKDKPFDPEEPLKDWTKEAHIDIKTVHYD